MPLSDKVISDHLVGEHAVETAPKIYLVLWGSQWDNNDPRGEASILERFYNGVGGSSWLNSVSQYCEGVATGTVFCKGAGKAAGNLSGMYAGVYIDSSSAAHFGNLLSSANASVPT